MPKRCRRILVWLACWLAGGGSPWARAAPDHPAAARPLGGADLYNELFFVRTARQVTPLVDRGGTYEYQPAAIRQPDGTLDVWYCTGTSGGGWPGDAVYHSRFDAAGNVLVPPTLAIDHTNLLGSADGQHACDVSVIRHAHPSLSWPGGSVPATVPELYLMYYECAPHLTDRDPTRRATSKRNVGPAQVCLAASVDGVSWMKRQAGLPNGHEFDPAVVKPTAVVGRDPAIDARCNLSETEDPGEWLADFPECDYDASLYGSGHPSAISVPTADPNDGDQREVWLYYWDSRGDAQQAGMYLRKSLDGVTFDPAQRIDLYSVDGGDLDTILWYAPGLPIRPLFGKQRWFDVRIGGRPGVFVAPGPMPVGNHLQNHFAYSFDGIRWVTATQTWPARPDLRLGSARSDDQDPDADGCVAPGDPGIVADAYGWVKSLTDVEILSGEGGLGFTDGCSGPGDVDPPHCQTCYDPQENVSRGSTWSLYQVRGDFGHIAPAGSDACTLYDETNVRQEVERGQAGSSGTIVWVDGGEYYGYTDWFDDFLPKNGFDPTAYLNVDNPTFDAVLACGSATPPLRQAYTVADSATAARGLGVKLQPLANDVAGLTPASLVLRAANGVTRACSSTAPLATAHGTVTCDPSTGTLTYVHGGDGATSDGFNYSARTAAGLLSSPAAVTVAIVAPQVLHRINVGGAALAGGWSEDRSWAAGGVPSSRVNAAELGDTTFETVATVAVDASAAGTPEAVFRDDRFALPPTPRMKWELPTNLGHQVEVRLYFAENFRDHPAELGVRVFDVAAEGSVRLDDVDLLSPAWANAKHRGIRRSFTAFTDGSLSLDFVPQSDDSPLLSGIEVLGVPPANPGPRGVSDALQATRGESAVAAVLANDVGAAAGTVVVAHPPLAGTATSDGSSITYRHGGGPMLADRFAYTVRDALGALSDTTVVTVSVIDPFAGGFADGFESGGTARWSAPTGP